MKKTLIASVITTMMSLSSPSIVCALQPLNTYTIPSQYQYQQIPGTTYMVPATSYPVQTNAATVVQTIPTTAKPTTVTQPVLTAPVGPPASGPTTTTTTTTTTLPVVPVSAPSGLGVGDLYLGGIVVWIDDAQDTTHGIITDIFDQDGTYDWVGAQNVCTSSGSGDSRLPTMRELQLMYNNAAIIKQVSQAHRGIRFDVIDGNFGRYGGYWSANEFDNNGAWVYDLYGGQQMVESKINSYYVRCVRSF